MRGSNKMVENDYQKMKDQLVEQKITKQVTITAGSTTTTSISIPRDKKVFLKGYGYSWYSTNEFTLSTGNRQFPTGSDQQGSPSIPMIFGNPFPCRSSGKLQLTIKNGDATDHTYDIVFYILTNDHLDETSTGSELILNTGSGTGSGGNVAIYDSTYGTPASVTADGLEVHIDKALPTGSNTIGDVTVSSIPIASSPASLVCDTKATTDANKIVLAGSVAIKEVTIQADVANTDAVLVGNTTNQLVRLEAGQSIDLKIANLNQIYIKRVGASNQTVNYIGA